MSTGTTLADVFIALRIGDRIFKEMAVAHFKVLFYSLLGRTEEIQG
jgi:hypothetical protein